MFEDYSWDLTGYVQKYPLPDEAFRQKDVARIFRLEPEPPAAEDLNSTSSPLCGRRIWLLYRSFSITTKKSSTGASGHS